MARKPVYRTVWCPRCKAERETGALPHTKLACASCGGHYRAPQFEDAEELPTASTAAPEPTEPVSARSSRRHGVIPASDAPQFGGRGGRGGRAAAKLRRAG